MAVKLQHISNQIDKNKHVLKGFYDFQGMLFKLIFRITQKIALNQPEYVLGLDQLKALVELFAR